ncbi:MAG: class I SAM-dependent methyltransferase [Bacteroidia bacterium]
MSLIKQIRGSWFSGIYKATILPRARKKAKLLKPMLNPKSKILEIGSGNCGLAYLLQKDFHSVTATDIVDCSFFNSIKPTVFNGEALPFKSKSFDYVLIITVLHHTTKQLSLLNEAKRLGNEVIVMEDLYTNKFGQRILHFTDSLVNLEFKGHPHTNRTDAGWRVVFKRLNLKITDTVKLRTLFFFRQIIYMLRS